MPLRLELAGVKGAGCECLLCGQETDPSPEVLSLFQDFRIPFLMMPAARFDYRNGWAFAVEERRDCQRVHLPAPLLVIDEATRSAMRAGDLTFELQAASANPQRQGGIRRSGALISSAREPPAAPPTPKKQPGRGLNVMVQAITRPGGSFKIKCAAAADAVAVDEQFPLYEILSLTGLLIKSSILSHFRSPC